MRIAFFRVAGLAVVFLLGSVFIGCGDDDDGPTPDGGVETDGSVDPDGGDPDGGIDTGCDDAGECPVPEDPCLVASCENRVCGSAPRDCSDGVDCTDDACIDGSCLSTTNAALCTDDILSFCDEETGCIEPPPCVEDTDCPGFGNFCAPQTCVDQFCTQGTNPCAASDAATCTGSICDEASGSCLEPPDHAACDDGAPCTTDTCDPAAAGADPISGCLVTPVHASCEDGVTCSTNTCDPTAAGADPATGCLFAADLTVCNDRRLCTTDICDPTAGNADPTTGCSWFDRCTLEAPSGAVKGTVRGTNIYFYGIPYAESTAGNQRWKPPVPVAPWGGDCVGDADCNPGTSCLVGRCTYRADLASEVCPNLSLASGQPQGSEDCLGLNIWIPDPMPSADDPVPVIIWIHTGSFTNAQSASGWMNQHRFVEYTRIIAVTLNYRLGAFGWMAHPDLTAEDPAYPSSGNYGLVDQRVGIQWVRDNIAAFGGDPNNITVAGTSAGGHSTSFHLVSPRSAGLFEHGIIMAGYGADRWQTLAEGEEQGERMATILGCDAAADVIACMRGKTIPELLLAAPSQGMSLFTETPGSVFWAPNVDGFEIPDQLRTLYESGAINPVQSLIIGANKDDSWTWVTTSFPGGLDQTQYEAEVTREFGADAPDLLAQYPYANYPNGWEALATLTQDLVLSEKRRLIARATTAAGIPTYMYQFEYPIPLATVQPGKVFHGSEHPIIFNNDYTPIGYLLRAEDRPLFEITASYMRRFAETGDPNGEGAVNWPVFTQAEGEYLVWNNTVEARSHFRDSELDFWDAYDFRSPFSRVLASDP